MPIELNTKTPNTQTAETMLNKFTEVANDNTKAKDIQSKALEVLAGISRARPLRFLRERT